MSSVQNRPIRSRPWWRVRRLALALTAVVGCVSAAPGSLTGIGGGIGAVATLPSTLTAIQTAFLANDATRLARLFPRRGPVFVSVPPIESGTFLAPGPLKAFLDRLVRERVSVAFELPAQMPEVTDGQAASTFVKVKWTHRPAASATLHVDYLHLALRYVTEDAEWQIVEIKTAQR